MQNPRDVLIKNTVKCSHFMWFVVLSDLKYEFNYLACYDVGEHFPILRPLILQHFKIADHDPLKYNIFHHTLFMKYIITQSPRDQVIPYFVSACNYNNLNLVEWIASTYKKEIITISRSGVSDIFRFVCSCNYIDMAKFLNNLFHISLNATIYSPNLYVPRLITDATITDIFVTICEKRFLDLAKWFVDEFKGFLIPYIACVLLKKCCMANNLEIAQWLKTRFPAETDTMATFECIETFNSCCSKGYDGICCLLFDTYNLQNHYVEGDISFIIHHCLDFEMIQTLDMIVAKYVIPRHTNHLFNISHDLILSQKMKDWLDNKIKQL